jgi:dienelactone hydrolase
VGRRSTTAVLALSLALAGASLGASTGASTGGVRGRRAAANPAACRAATATAPVQELPAGAGRTVVRFTVTLVARRRSTPAAPDRPARPCRVLPTVIRYPAGTTGPVPLVVVAHGRDNDPSSLATLLDAWAGAGYVVAAPTFPLTRKDRNGEPLRSESVAQAADLSFVVDRMVAAGRAGAPGPLGGLVDAHHVGAAGMSLGGLAVYGLVSNTCCRDRRVTAAELLAAVRRDFPDDEYQKNHAPVLLVQGDADPGYHNSVDAYPELAPPKWFVTLGGSEHAPPFEVPPGPEAPLVYSMTTAFWNRYLKGDVAADGQITSAVAAAGGEFRLRRDLGRSSN